MLDFQVRDSEASARPTEAYPSAAQLGHRWAAALRVKKAAMENLLEVQRSLEEVQEIVANHLPKEILEGAHARFLSTINSTSPEALYLFAVGRLVVYPPYRRESRRMRFDQQGSVATNS